jgi:hypothetical protein
MNANERESKLAKIKEIEPLMNGMKTDGRDKTSGKIFLNVLPTHLLDPRPSAPIRGKTIPSFL